jgi:hypothetical protein
MGAFPQRLKPREMGFSYGTTEVVPFQNKSCPFKTSRALSKPIYETTSRDFSPLGGKRNLTFTRAALKLKRSVEEE